MTDPDHLDELASAHLDGATTPEEVARIEADPELRARVDALRAVRVALQAPPSIDAARRDQAVRAALAAYDEGDAPATVTSLAEIAARRGPSARSLRLLGAAAAVALLAALVPLINTLSDSSSDDVAATSGNERDADAAGDDSTGAGGLEATPEAAADSAVTSTTSTSGLFSENHDNVVELGAFDDEYAVIDAARAAVADGSESYATVAPDAPIPCLDATIGSLPPDTTVVFTGKADVTGRGIFAVVVTEDQIIVSGGDCGSPVSEPR